jgi:hypothetical protein
MVKFGMRTMVLPGMKIVELVLLVMPRAEGESSLLR